MDNPFKYLVECKKIGDLYYVGMEGNLDTPDDADFTVHCHSKDDNEARLKGEFIVNAINNMAKANTIMFDALKDMAKNYDHCEDSHRYNNEAACRVCIAEKALSDLEKIKG